MPFKGNTFDIVYTYHLTWHLPPEIQKKIILEMLRIVKKGGYVNFDVLNSSFLWKKIKNILKLKRDGGIYKMDIHEVEKILPNSNYVLEKLIDFPIKNNKIYSIFNLMNKCVIFESLRFL